jgi:hypothetical protein
MALPTIKAKTTPELNNILLDTLGDAVLYHSDISNRPLIIELSKPSLRKFRVYFFNCNNPPGGRPIDEYKIVLNLGQVYGQVGNFDYSDGCLVLVMGYVSKFDTFILWDASKHKDFAFNKNMQVKVQTILAALGYPISTQQRRTDNGIETILSARRAHLLDAINLRVELLYKDLVGEN